MNKFIIEKAYINGEFLDSKKKIEVYNPSNNQLIGKIPMLGIKETKLAIDSANRAFLPWKNKTAKQRSDILKKWASLVLENKDELAKLISLEQGKPLNEAKNEIVYSASFLEWFGEEAKRVYGDTIPAPSEDKRIIVIKQAVGVVGAITPWNFPSAMITRKIAPAIALGCTVIVKPSSKTPYSAIALALLAKEANLPKGVLNILTGDACDISKELCINPIVRKLSFTGSTQVGKILMRDCASNIKKLSLELGGNAPFIVFDDANLDKAVEGAIASKYRNSGQTCVCVNRFIVHIRVYEEFIEKLANKVAKLKVCDGMISGCEQGPLIDKKAVLKVKEHIRDAKEKGAKLVIGGNSLDGNFFEPSILRDVSKDMLVFTDETFGPLASVCKFETEEEAISLANDTEFGLASYFYSKDISRVFKVAESLESGIVGINTGTFSSEMAPFGGIKQSGIGREGSKYGIDDFLELKYLCIGDI